MTTVEVAPRGPRPPIRVRPVPRSDPPFDDELEPQMWATANQLALEWPTPTATQQLPPAARQQGTLTAAERHTLANGAQHAPTARLQPALSTRQQPASAGSQQPASNGRQRAHAARQAPTEKHPDAGRGAASEMDLALSSASQRPLPPIVAGASGDAKLAVRRFVQMCVEVLNGYRPAAHLRRLALPKEAAGVVAQALAGTSRVAELRRPTQGRPTQGRPIRRDRQPRPVGVIRLRLCEPRPGAVEAAVLLVTGERTWAMALRLELHQQSWCATTLRLI